MRWPISLIMFAVISLVGCSNGDTSSPVAAVDAEQPSQAQSRHPAAVSASTFLQAITKGDEATALARLTPMAAEQMTSGGKRFAFSAVEAAEFKVTKVWQPQPDEAAVQYHMAAQAGDEAVEFEVCCFMRNVQGDWRLGGIAYDLGEGQEPVVVNYEAPSTPAPAENPAQTVANPGAQLNSTQTAQGPISTQTR